MTDYQRIEQAILYLKDNFKRQPSLEEVAQQVYVSPFHFQRMFKEWAGVSPKKFLQFISVEHAKALLTPGEYKNGGGMLTIHYSFAESPFGDIIIATTDKGVCHLSFTANEAMGIAALKENFPNARLIQKTDFIQQDALHFFTGDWNDLKKVKLHLKGTPFQLKVWESLLRIPFGHVSTYAGVAAGISNSKASRAVGSAIGSNPVAYLIPCHRVIRSTGVIGEYHWGSPRKTAILGWEASKIYAAG